MAQDFPCGGREPVPGELHGGEGGEGWATGATQAEGQEGRLRMREESWEPLCQTGRAWELRGQRERRGRQEGLHPLPAAGVVGPPCSEWQDMTSGAWELGALAGGLGTHSRMYRSSQVGDRQDFLALILKMNGFEGSSLMVPQQLKLPR